MLIIVHFSYEPNTASTNRLLSYLNNFPLETMVKVFFLMPDRNRSKIEFISPNIEVEYCWEHYRFLCKVTKPLIYRHILRSIKRGLKKGDVVYCYNIPAYINDLYKEGVRFYGERTETPEVTTSPSRLIPFSINKHLELCRKLDGVFVISTALRDYYVLNGIEKEKIKIINMTVDPKRFEGLFKTRVQHKYIAYCGNGNNTKDGLDILIRAFALIVAEFPNLYLYVIGSNSSKDDNINNQLIRDLGLVERIIFTGVVPASEVPQLLKNAELCALARPDSLQAKCGFPTKLGEYLLTANPVVVTSVGDIPLFLENEISALLVQPGNPEEFANKLRWVLENNIESMKIGQMGYEVAQKHFNAEIEVRKMLNFMQL